MNKMILYVLTTVTLLLVGCISLPYVGKLVKDNISED
jgi:starvation-inducible outer membrane lipoprotein